MFFTEDVGEKVIQINLIFKCLQKQVAAKKTFLVRSTLSGDSEICIRNLFLGAFELCLILYFMYTVFSF